MQRLLNHVWHLCLGGNPRGPHHLSRTDCSTASNWLLRSDHEAVHGSLRMQMNQALQALRLRNVVTHAQSGNSLTSSSVATLKLLWYFFQHEAQISKGFKIWDDNDLDLDMLLLEYNSVSESVGFMSDAESHVMSVWPRKRLRLLATPGHQQL